MKFPLLCALVAVCACPALAQPATPDAPAPEQTAPSVERVPLTQADLMTLLDVRMWKWRLRSPAPTKAVFFVRSDWRKEEKNPRLRHIIGISLDPEVPPLAGDFQDVLVRWPDSLTNNLTCSFSGITSRLSPSTEDEPFKDQPFNIRSNAGYATDQKEVKINEPFVLVRAAYRSDFDYRTAFDEGAEQKNDRTLAVMLIATDKEGRGMKARWKDGKIVVGHN